MGVNMAGNCIVDDEACREASNMEILRRYYASLNRLAKDECQENEVLKIELIMKQAKISPEDRKVTVAANTRAASLSVPCAAIELNNGKIITGKTTPLLGASAAVLLNSLKELAHIPKEVHLIAPEVVAPIQKLKVDYLGSRNPRLHTDEVLIALSMCTSKDANAQKAMEMLPALKDCQVHTSVMLSAVDIQTFKKLGMMLTSEPVKG